MQKNGKNGIFFTYVPVVKTCFLGGDPPSRPCLFTVLRIPSCRGYQLHVFFRVLLAFFHLNLGSMSVQRFFENSDGLMKSPILVYKSFFIAPVIFSVHHALFSRFDSENSITLTPVLN